MTTKSHETDDTPSSEIALANPMFSSLLRHAAAARTLHFQREYIPPYRVEVAEAACHHE